VRGAKTIAQTVKKGTQTVVKGANSVVKNAIASAKSLPKNATNAAKQAYRGAEKWLTQNPKAAMALGVGALVIGGVLTGGAAFAIVGGAGLLAGAGGLTLTGALVGGGALAGAGGSALLQGAQIDDKAIDPHTGKAKTFSLGETAMGSVTGAAMSPLALGAMAAPTVAGVVGLGTALPGLGSAYQNFQAGNSTTAAVEGVLSAAAVMPFLSKSGRQAMFGAQARQQTMQTFQGVVKGGRSLLNWGTSGFRPATVGSNPSTLGQFQPRMTTPKSSVPEGSTPAATRKSGSQLPDKGSQNGQGEGVSPSVKGDKKKEVGATQIPKKTENEGSKPVLGKLLSEKKPPQLLRRSESKWQQTGQRELFQLKENLPAQHETTNALTNLGKNHFSHNSATLKDFTPIAEPTKTKQTVFSGVYDPKTKTFLTKPTGNTRLSNGEVPEDLQPARGGHGAIEKIFQGANPEIDNSKTMGFTIYYKEEGKLDVAFYSGSINMRNYPKLKGYAPENYQKEFSVLLGESTGLEVNVSPRLQLPD
jgi:hypothetical protein